jgi:type I restriction enzyme S subunit
MSQPINALPDDWQVFHLGDLLDFSNGINADKSAYGSGVPFANVLEVITNESLREVDIPGRVDVAGKVLSRYQVRRGDILFNRTSETQDEVGLTSVYLDDKPVVFGGFVFRGRPIAEAMDINYSKYALRADYVRTQIMARGQGGIRANIGQRDLKSVTVALPPLREQRDMAEALDDASHQVKLIERSIINQQAIKQGMMQQLLTGRIRISGFSKPWIELTAGDVGAFKGGSGFPVKYQGLTAGDYPFFKVSDMNSDSNALFMRNANHYITEAQRKQIGSGIVPKNAIVFAKVGAAIFLERKRILSQASCIDNNMAALIPDRSKADVRFIHYLLTNFAMSSLVATTALPSLNGTQLRSIPLSMPTDLNEQRAIVSALTACDNEDAVLRMRLVKAHAVKQGMMQQLLTGRTRLVPVREP